MFVPQVDNRRHFTALLVALVLLAWLALFAWGESPYARYLSHEELSGISFSLDGDTLAATLLFVSGWTVMTVAMMLPTSLPLISMFQKVVSRRQDRTFLWLLLLAGYLAVWTAFGVAVHSGDRLLHAAVEQSHWLDDRAWLIGAGTLVAAGIYQFTPLKYMCLDKCRSPLNFITSHWHGSNERSSAFKLGVHHGIFCVGCCWSLMMLMFAVGVGNVGWMLVLGIVMATEKNMPWGRRLSAPLGVALVVAGAALFLLAGGPEACAHNTGDC
jgi:predicted metal-binding membrane protein